MSSTENRQENLTDLFTTALEGGIGYWSVAYAYKHTCPYADRYALLAPCEDDDLDMWRESGVRIQTHAVGPGQTVEVAVLTPAKMGTGLWKLAKACPQRRTSSGVTFATLSRHLGSDDFDDYDAGDADVIAQFALGLVTVHDDGHTTEIYG